jgi:hypothetical protein
MDYTQSPTHFPRQVGEIALEFDDWANKVRQQMMTCLQKKRTEEKQPLD